MIIQKMEQALNEQMGKEMFSAPCSLLYAGFRAGRYSM